MNPVTALPTPKSKYMKLTRRIGQYSSSYGSRSRPCSSGVKSMVTGITQRAVADGQVGPQVDALKRVEIIRYAANWGPLQGCNEPTSLLVALDTLSSFRDLPSIVLNLGPVSGLKIYCVQDLGI